MALTITRRLGRVVVAGSVHPEYRTILGTFLANLDPELVTVPAPDGRVDPSALAEAVTDDTAAVIVQYPNFFGQLEDVEALVDLAHRKGALAIVSVDPISLGLLRRPGILRRRYRGGRGAESGQSAGVRRPVPRYHGLPRGICPQDAGPDRRPDDRPPRQAVLGPDPSDPRAAHPPREGDVEHLHEPGPARAPARASTSPPSAPAACSKPPSFRPARRTTPPSSSPRSRVFPWPSMARFSRSS